MLTLSCHCGEISVRINKKPDFIFECNCTLCSKSGARWAYLHPSEVEVTGVGATYRRTDKPDPAADLNFCPTCGSTTHFTLTESAVAKYGNTQTGVNMRLAKEADLAGIELHYPDGQAWSGEGDFTYVRPSEVLGRRAEHG